MPVLTGTDGVITVSGVNINLNDPSTIVCGSFHNNPNGYNTARMPDATSPYAINHARVPSGKKWTLLAFTSYDDTGTKTFTVGHGTGVETDTNDPVGGDLFINGINQPVIYPFTADVGNRGEFTGVMVVPALNYPFTRASAGSMAITLYFKEEDAT